MANKRVAKDSSKSKARSQNKKSSSTVRMSIADYFRQQLGMDPREFEEYAEFVQLKDAEKRRASREIITAAIIEAATNSDRRIPLALAQSESLLPKYATLDEPHLDEIQKLINHVTGYIRDETRQRPMNALMLASPGAGKSHFIKQLAEKMKPDRVQAVTFNMATMNSPDDMAQPIDAVRNVKVEDQFPLLFLDEFDSDPSRYAALLPLLWDGELQIGHRSLKLGKAVVVLAGSNPDLPKAMAQSATMRLESETTETVQRGKLVDLLSRINGGVIEIPDLDLRTGTRDRRVDKVCATIALIRRRFGNDLHSIPRSLLRFIAHTQFRYGVRSIAHLIDSINKEAFSAGTLHASKLGIPMDSEKGLSGSSMTLHLLDKDQGFGIVNRWREFAKDKFDVEITPRKSVFGQVSFDWLESMSSLGTMQRSQYDDQATETSISQDSEKKK